MAPTPYSAKPNQTQIRTPQSRQRLNFTSTKTTTTNTTTQASANPNSTTRETPPQDHPIEVIGRIRNFPNPNTKEKPVSVLQINPDKQTVRVRADVGYRDFSLDGVSLSEEEDLESFYEQFVESRIKTVKLGEKCTIMMYGSTGSGKSHTMFGCAQQPAIVYRSLRDILGEESDKEDRVGFGTFVQVTVLEIYNEEIYDLLSNNNGGGSGFGIGWPKGSASKVCVVFCGDASEELYNGCIMAVHAPDALKMLGSQATFDVMRILGAFQYVYSDIFLHCDKKFIPQNTATWSAWNFLVSTDNKVCVTHWLNVLQNIGETSLPYLVTLNPDHAPENTLIKWSTAHPVPSVAASKASLELDHV